jgi:hypothetical protein
MVRSFALVLLVGTIVVQCTNPAPPPPIGEPKTATRRTLNASTPTRTPLGKGVKRTSPTTTKTPEVSTTTTPETSTEKLPECVKKDCNCSDFSTQAQAQSVLNKFPDDPHNLDKNKDGVACESLP